MSGEGADANGFEALIESVRDEAVAAGIAPGVIDAAFAGVLRLSGGARAELLRRDTAQPEHALAAGDYFRRLVTAGRISRGREHMISRGPELERISTRFGVPAPLLLAIWGIESDFGSAMGSGNVIENLASLATGDQRRQSLWRRELLAAVQIVARRPIGAAQPVGSWAGAMGHAQFMPSTYLAYGVDFDGCGVCDIWSSVPDALASAANYLSCSGWVAGETWGHEVQLGARFDYARIDPESELSWRAWREAGVAAIAAEPVASDRLRLMLPAGWRGPAFLVTRNFDAILTYNRSVIYALAVGCLADAIAGGTGLSTHFPDEAALERAERLELQRLLVEEGFDTNGVDGIFGRATGRAARACQLRYGITPDGHAGAELLSFLRGKRV